MWPGPPRRRAGSGSRVGDPPGPAAVEGMSQLSRPAPCHPPRSSEHVRNSSQNAEVWILVGFTELLGGLSSHDPVTFGFLCELWFDVHPRPKPAFRIHVGALFGFPGPALES